MDIDALGIRVAKLEERVRQLTGEAPSIEAANLQVSVELTPELRAYLAGLHERIAALELEVNGETSAPIEPPHGAVEPTAETLQPATDAVEQAEGEQNAQGDVNPDATAQQ